LSLAKLFEKHFIHFFSTDTKVFLMKTAAHKVSPSFTPHSAEMLKKVVKIVVLLQIKNRRRMPNIK